MIRAIALALVLLAVGCVAEGPAQPGGGAEPPSMWSIFLFGLMAVACWCGLREAINALYGPDRYRMTPAQGAFFFLIQIPFLIGGVLFSLATIGLTVMLVEGLFK